MSLFLPSLQGFVWAAFFWPHHRWKLSKRMAWLEATMWASRDTSWGPCPYQGCKKGKQQEQSQNRDQSWGSDSSFLAGRQSSFLFYKWSSLPIGQWQLKRRKQYDRCTPRFFYQHKSTPTLSCHPKFYVKSTMERLTIFSCESKLKKSNFGWPFCLTLPLP